ncbi:ATP-binding cassette domain-containing protein [Paracoccus onubensis]|uniref:ATP-binding cassette domain-containing protein n=1 Tax=Paracoccus onubensis TaxID=1675788 RepID=UPI0027313369|nr:ATP-binding cassette domain-containing protein [Paracoccus onubensis]MDP0926853.1 ATP-binding cassette domain-containing protein [Paracoccus onubensis]
MERMTPLLTASGLAIGHGGKKLISGIDLCLEPGSVLCLLGPNGAGKTTLFRTLLGLIPAIRGEIRLAGEPLSRLSRVQIASLDFANRVRVGIAIRQLARAGTGIILSSHDPDQTATLADHALLLNGSGTIASGTVSDALTAENLSRLYGIPVHRERSKDGCLHFY